MVVYIQIKSEFEMDAKRFEFQANGLIGNFEHAFSRESPDFPNLTGR